MKNEAQNHRRSSRRRLVGWVLSSFFILHPSSFLLADSVFVGTLERKNAIIRELKGDTLVFELSGRLSEAPAAKITRLVVQGEEPLNKAEDAYASGKWEEAVDGYQKTIRTTGKQWVKDWAALRLIEAANKTGRFDAAAAAYILTLIKDPTSAVAMKPAMPDSKSTFLDTAVSDLNAALGDSKLTTDQRRALLGFLIELHQARKDATAEDAAYEQLIKLPGADVNDPNARRVLVKRKLAVASRALDANDFQRAINEVDSNRAMFVEPAQQADALYIIAQSRHGLAGDDATALKDAALAYMRVVAVAKDDPSRPHVVQSLLATASILEKLGEPQTATRLYEQVVVQYPDDPSTIKAKEALQRMSKQAAGT
jgi:tetratricopeptide (TPR) repeat protein